MPSLGSLGRQTLPGRRHMVAVVVDGRTVAEVIHTPSLAGAGRTYPETCQPRCKPRRPQRCLNFPQLFVVILDNLCNDTFHV